MLHIEAVEPGTFSLLKRLMELPSLASCSLAGGTALALRYGHRASIDLDLFCSENIDLQLSVEELERTFGDQFLYEPGTKTIGIFSIIQNIKVDIVRYPHPQIKPIEVNEGIRLFSDADIGAMKIQAILGRGRKKDFWDLQELLKNYPLQQILSWHSLKYPSQMLAISIPNALTYFVDAEESGDPVSFKNQTWSEIKRDIQQVVRDYLK